MPYSRYDVGAVMLLMSKLELADTPTCLVKLDGCRIKVQYAMSRCVE